jgi:hypothetical protein
MPLPLVAGIVLRGLASQGLRRLAVGATTRHLKKKGVQKIVNKYGKTQFQKGGKFITDPGKGTVAKGIDIGRRLTTDPFGTKTKIGRIANIGYGASLGSTGSSLIENAKQDAAMSSPTHDSSTPNFRGNDLINKPPGADLKLPSTKKPDPSKAFDGFPTKPEAKKPAAPKPYVKKGGKATGFIKDYAIGSEGRRKEYDARGWKYDETIKGYDKSGNKIKTTPVSSIIKKPIATPPAAPKATSSTSSKPKDTVITSSTLTNYLQKPSSKPFSKRGNKLFSDMASIRGEANKILSSGEPLSNKEQRKVQKLRKKYDRKEKRFQKHNPSITSGSSSSNTQSYTSTIQLPKGSTMFDARGSYSKLAAQNAANAYSQGDFSLSDTNMTYDKKRNKVSLTSAYKIKLK